MTVKRKRIRIKCNFNGCTNQAQKGGVCITHGAKKPRCSHAGCTNQAVKGGVCVTHGAQKKQCSVEGCTKQVKKGGVCVTHGAKVGSKRCNFKGCTSYSPRKGGVCYRHRSKSINAINNPAQEANAFPPSVSLPHQQAVDYEEEEELNYWIWGSSRMPRKLD